MPARVHCHVNGAWASHPAVGPLLVTRKYHLPETPPKRGRGKLGTMGAPTAGRTLGRSIFMEDNGTAVTTCAELSVGDDIEAWHNGRLFHRGRVTQTVPLMELFWILDSRTGARKLLDVEALEIIRCAPDPAGRAMDLAQPA